MPEFVSQLMDKNLSYFGLAFFVLMFCLLEFGYRGGKFLRPRIGKLERPPTAVGFIVGGMLTLLAFFLGAVLTIASSEYRQRQAAILQEARSIGSAWQIADAQPDQVGSRIQNRLLAYADVRIAAISQVHSRDDEARFTAQTLATQAEIWRIAVEAAQLSDSRLSVLQLEALDTAFSDALSQRATAEKRIPGHLSRLLLVTAMITVLATGLYMGTLGYRLFAMTTLLLAVISSSAVLITDISRPYQGSIKMSAQPLVWTLEEMRR